MKRFYVGIDISKKWLDFAIWDSSKSKIICSKHLDNKSTKIKDYLKNLIRRYSKEELWFCCEHTGNYGLELIACFEEQEVNYSVVPAQEIILSIGMKRGKNDTIDAKRIAEYAAVNQHKIKPSKLPAKSLMKAKQLLTQRRQLVRYKNGFKNSRKAHILASKVSGDELTVSVSEEMIKELEEKIKLIEKEISEVLKDIKEIQKNMELVQSVIGIGFITAAQIIVLTNNFQSFTDHRKFCCYTGIAPFESSSGLLKSKAKTSKLRNKVMKALMMNVTNSAVQHDPQLRKYYLRKVEEGKNEFSVLNAVAYKIIARVFAVVKRQKPYVILQN